jgi:hypothetical protein
MGVNVNRVFNISSRWPRRWAGGGMMVGIYYNTVYPARAAPLARGFAACIFVG